MSATVSFAVLEHGHTVADGGRPHTVAPSLKVTVPLGTPAPGATTPILAVKVTVCPKAAVVADDVKAAVVAAS